MSRPSKYDELKEQGLLTRAEGWARDGLTDEQIATNIGIVPSTLYEWKKKYEEFSEVLKKGKDLVDREVENALLKRALGYKYDETTYEQVAVKDGEGKVIGHRMEATKIVTKEVHPDTTAQIFWLKNRKPEEWRDKQNIEHSGDAGVRIINDIPRNGS